MSTVKNTSIMLGVFVILSAFVLSGQPSLAASTTHTAHDTKDVCDDIESTDDEQEIGSGNSDSDENDAEDICEQAESVKLASQVAISEAKARSIAETNYSGNGNITELLLARDEDEHNVSRIVYEMEFTESDGTQVDVKVDANTGVYLGVDTEDDEDWDNVKQDANPAHTQALRLQLLNLLQQLVALLKAQ